MKNVREIIFHSFLNYDMRRNKIIFGCADYKLYNVKGQMMSIRIDIGIKIRPILVQYQW